MVKTRNVKQLAMPAEKCDVSVIANQVDGLWREHNRIEGMGKPEPFQERLMGRLFEASEALQQVASTKRAASIEGALFQLSLAYDCVQNLDLNKHSDQDEGKILHQVKCLLFSATDVVRGLAARDTARRFMPPDHDPLGIFDAANRA